MDSNALDVAISPTSLFFITSQPMKICCSESYTKRQISLNMASSAGRVPKRRLTSRARSGPRSGDSSIDYPAHPRSGTLDDSF
jgi:hypothetical protein